VEVGIRLLIFAGDNYFFIMIAKPPFVVPSVWVECLVRREGKEKYKSEEYCYVSDKSVP
jgi:hypothetical protein